MFGNSEFDHVRQIFQDQFSTDSNGFIYRKDQKGVPIRVSEFERDNFCAVFNKKIRYAVWSAIPATIILILLLVWLGADTKSAMGNMAIWVGLAAIFVSLMAMYYWVWNAPARALQHRTPEGAALTKEEARAVTWSQITYSRLALVAAAGVGLVWKMSLKMDVLHGGGVVWLVFGSILIALAGIQVIRKWLFNQQ